MAREEMTKSINGEEYTFYQLGAIQSNKLLWRIKRILGPSLIGMLNKASGEGLESLLDADVDLESVANSFYERATEGEVDFIINRLLSQVTHKGVGSLDKEATIDEHFKGELARMYKVLWEAFKHEYSDFFPDGGIINSLKSKAAGSQKKPA
jgi:hypothetical protein